MLGEITSTVVSESGSCVLISAWEAIASYATHEAAPVGAGLQASLRMFISHTAQVFLIKQHTVAKLDKLVDVCHEVILLYQDMATEWKLDSVSWYVCCVCMCVCVRMCVCIYVYKCVYMCVGMCMCVL